jgi:hypothetical protein
MKNLLLSVALIAVPVAGFATVLHFMPHAAVTAADAASPGLGDLSAFVTIVADTQTLADTGDLVAAEKRITDLEVAWDDAAQALRAKDTAAWATVDDAADAVFSALREGTPKPAIVKSALLNLSTTLTQPIAAIQTGGFVLTVRGIAVTDENGHPIPCEVMLTSLKAAAETAGRGTDPAVTDLLAKGTERCNADDDKNADTFSAQGLALLAK